MKKKSSLPKSLPKSLPHGGVSLEAQSALVCAVEVLEVEDLVIVVIHGNEFQRRAAMKHLEKLSDVLEPKHLMLLSRVQSLPVREADCAGRCRSLASLIRFRYQQKAKRLEATTAEAVA